MGKLRGSPLRPRRSASQIHARWGLGERAQRALRVAKLEQNTALLPQSCTRARAWRKLALRVLFTSNLEQERSSVSNRNARVIALAGAAALAGFGYTLARRSSRPGSPRRGAPSSKLAEPITAPDAVPWQQEAERISSSPDALDLALDLDGVFDGKLADESEVTVRRNEHVPSPHTRDDEDPPAPEDLGRAWLIQATESERSLGTADTLPEVENLAQANDDQGESADSEGDDLDDDETTAEYVRRHRISSAG